MLSSALNVPLPRSPSNHILPSRLEHEALDRTHMTQSRMPIPPNSIPMLGFDGQFGNTVLGGMANVLRVRKDLKAYEKDPGPYHFPEGSVAAPPTQADLERDGIYDSSPAALPWENCCQRDSFLG